MDGQGFGFSHLVGSPPFPNAQFWLNILKSQRVYRAGVGILQPEWILVAVDQVMAVGIVRSLAGRLASGSENPILNHGGPSDR